ncbi:MAG: LysM peptidoglycan-binding domain-containing protein [Chloroflexi bacterium]|nr:MAG: LysM peptidoglycan-binding domain-containing protein [Chloroflexota bacterium]
MRSRALLATVAILVATACGGNAAKATPTPGTVATAAPFATLPQATVVTGTPTPSATPTASTSGEQSYTVVAGDVLGSIAEKFDVPASQIRAANNLTSDALQIGQKLKIPVRSPSTATATPTTTSGGLTTYTVKEGDTAFGIALKFDTSVEALEKTNGVAKGGLDKLSLNQVLTLPQPVQR